VFRLLDRPDSGSRRNTQRRVAPFAFTGEEEQRQWQQALDSAQAPQSVTRLPLGNLCPESGLISWIDDHF
jgi:hypothetical protein